MDWPKCFDHLEDALKHAQLQCDELKKIPAPKIRAFVGHLKIALQTALDDMEVLAGDIPVNPSLFKSKPRGSDN